MKRLVLLCYSIMLTFGTVVSQNEPLKKIGELPVAATGVVTDKIGNIYTFKNEEIMRHASKSDRVRRESFKKYGNISSVDVINPLKILVFFQDLVLIVFLDNELGIRGQTLELDFMGYPQVTAVCRSYDNGTWLFDKSTFRLSRLSENLRETNSTSNLMQITGSQINPDMMIETNRRLYLSDYNEGIFVFDFFGTFIRKIHAKGVKSLDFFGDNVYFLTDKEIGILDETTSDIHYVDNPNKEATSMAVQKNRILLSDGKKIDVFEVK